MNNTENPSTGSWERIQGGVRETERLIGQKKYNLAMIKSRQTLEFMVKSLCDKAGIVENGLIDMIDALFENRIISKATCDHYHKIRTIGNKANHEEDNSAYNANQAYHLLSQEVHTFANEYSDRKNLSSTPIRSTASRNPSSRSGSSRQDEDPPRRHSSSSGRSNSRRRKARSSGFSLDPGSLLKPLLLIAIIIVLFFIIKMMSPDKEKPKETTAPVTTEMTTEATTEETETEEPTTAAPVIYKTTDTVNVRPSPSSSADTGRIGLLAPGTQVEFIRDHDEKWSVINYNGKEAYVAKEFLAPQ